jgi:hypothetical protein
MIPDPAWGSGIIGVAFDFDLVGIEFLEYQGDAPEYPLVVFPVFVGESVKSSGVGAENDRGNPHPEDVAFPYNQHVYQDTPLQYAFVPQSIGNGKGVAVIRGGLYQFAVGGPSIPVDFFRGVPVALPGLEQTVALGFPYVELPIPNARFVLGPEEQGKPIVYPIVVGAEVFGRKNNAEFRSRFIGFRYRF